MTSSFFLEHPNRSKGNDADHRRCEPCTRDPEAVRGSSRGREEGDSAGVPAGARLDARRDLEARA